MKFGVVVADPPWSYEDKLRMGGTTGVKRSADSHYAVMNVDEIAKLGPLLEPLLADDCVLGLWCPNSLVTYAVQVWQAWGFVQKQVFTWVKSKQDGTGFAFGMGRYFRNCTESLYLCTRGRPKILRHDLRNVVAVPSLKHSAKPEVVQSYIESLFPGPYLELFARRDRPGWTCTGLECPSTSGTPIRAWLQWAALKLTEEAKVSAPSPASPADNHTHTGEVANADSR